MEHNFAQFEFGVADSREIRTESRVEIPLRCDIRYGTRPWGAVILKDLSVNGFQVSCSSGWRPGAQVRLRIPGLELLPATVRWLADGKAGCSFDRPLSRYVLEHLIKQAGLHCDH